LTYLNRKRNNVLKSVEGLSFGVRSLGADDDDLSFFSVLMLPVANGFLCQLTGPDASAIS
jgi:hypothetical protein